jgi:hypothetical protein
LAGVVSLAAFAGSLDLAGSLGFAGSLVAFVIADALGRVLACAPGSLGALLVRAPGSVAGRVACPDVACPDVAAERTAVPCAGVCGLTPLAGVPSGRAVLDEAEEDEASGGRCSRALDVGMLVRPLAECGIARGTGADGSRRTGTGAADRAAAFVCTGVDDPLCIAAGVVAAVCAAGCADVVAVCVGVSVGVGVGDPAGAGVVAACEAGDATCGDAEPTDAEPTGAEPTASASTCSADPAAFVAVAACSVSPFSPLKSLEKIPIFDPIHHGIKIARHINVCLLRLCRRCERARRSRSRRYNLSREVSVPLVRRVAT